MDESIRVRHTRPTILEASSNSAAPDKQNCLMQISHIHQLRGSEENYHQHQYNLSMHMLRKHEGLHAPLKMGMELFAARKIGRLPFLPSSHIMEDVLLGRDEMIGFEDFLGSREFDETMRQPHIVTEKALGIL